LATGSAPRYAPDGSRIAIGDPLRIVDLLSGDERRVFNDDEGVDVTVGCEWSPDGKQLAVCVEREENRELVLVGVERDAPPPRVRLRAEVQGAPAWSPDGKQLAVTIYEPERKARRIHLLFVEGDDPAVLIPGQHGDTYDPAWSPDGRALAFASTRHPAQN
jgi:Tol biopolymer transport system component